MYNWTKWVRLRKHSGLLRSVPFDPWRHHIPPGKCELHRAQSHPWGNAHILTLGKEDVQCSGHRNTFFGDLESITKLTLIQKENHPNQSLENLETSLRSRCISVPWVGFEEAPPTVGWGSPGGHWELWGCVSGEGADESHSRHPTLGFQRQVNHFLWIILAYFVFTIARVWALPFVQFAWN